MVLNHTIEFVMKPARTTIPPKELTLEFNGVTLTKEAIEGMVVDSNSDSSDEGLDVAALTASFKEKANEFLNTNPSKKETQSSVTAKKEIKRDNKKPKKIISDSKSLEKSSDSSSQVIKEIKILQKNDGKSNWIHNKNYENRLSNDRPNNFVNKSYTKNEGKDYKNFTFKKFNNPIVEKKEPEVLPPQIIEEKPITFKKLETLPTGLPNPYYDLNYDEPKIKKEIVKKPDIANLNSITSNKIESITKESLNKEDKLNEEFSNLSIKDRKESNVQTETKDTKEKTPFVFIRPDMNTQTSNLSTKDENVVKPKPLYTNKVYTESAQHTHVNKSVSNSSEINNLLSKLSVGNTKYQEVGAIKKPQSKIFEFSAAKDSKIFTFDPSKIIKHNHIPHREALKKEIMKCLDLPSFSYDSLIKDDKINLRAIRELLEQKKILTDEMMGKIRLHMRNGKLREEPKVINNFKEKLEQVKEIPVKITLNQDIFKKTEKKVEVTPYTKFITQMNRVTWKNISECTEEILKIGPVSDEEMKEFARVTYKKCVGEKVFLKVYISLMTVFSKKLLTINEVNNEKRGLKVKSLFMKEIQRLCKEAIETNSKFLCSFENMTENEKESAYIESNTRRERILESIDTLGLLYKDGLTSLKAFQSIICNVGEFKIEDDIEIFAYTIKLWGPILITKQKLTDLNNALALIKTINPKCSFRMKFKIEDAIEELMKFDPRKELKYEIPWTTKQKSKTTKIPEKLKLEDTFSKDNRFVKPIKIVDPVEAIYDKYFKRMFGKAQIESLISEIEDVFQEIYDFSDAELEKEIGDIRKKFRIEYFNVAGLMAGIQNNKMNQDQLNRFLKLLFIKQKDIDCVKEVCEALKEDFPWYGNRLNTLLSSINKV